MSTLPLAPSMAGPAVVVAGVPGAVQAGDAAAAAGTFAALMAAAIIGGPVVTGPAKIAGHTGTPGEELPEGAPSEEAAATDDELAAVPGLSTHGGVLGSAWSPVTAQAEVAAAAAGAESADVAAVTTTAPATVLATAPASPATPTTVPATGGPAQGPDAVAGPALPGAGAAAPVTPAIAATVEPGGAPVEAAPATAPAPSGTSPAGQPGGPSAAAPTQAAAGSPTGSQAPSPAPVADQVLPEVVRLVSSTTTPTTRRVTLQLAPEALGEVRVVLSVRDGAVRVSLAAGQEAQRALLEGTPELRRLLEATGAGDARILVRDLATTPQNTPSATPAGTTGQPGPHGDQPQSGDGAARGGDGREHQHAGTRGGSNAKDGNQDGTPSGDRPNESVTGARVGIDVTV